MGAHGGANLATALVCMVWRILASASRSLESSAFADRAVDDRDNTAFAPQQFDNLRDLLRAA